MRSSGPRQDSCPRSNPANHARHYFPTTGAARVKWRSFFPTWRWSSVAQTFPTSKKNLAAGYTATRYGGGIMDLSESSWLGTIIDGTEKSISFHKAALKDRSWIRNGRNRTCQNLAGNAKAAKPSKPIHGTFYDLISLPLTITLTNRPAAGQLRWNAKIAVRRLPTPYQSGGSLHHRTSKMATADI